ncbi:MAG: hypothetical protein ACRDNS_28480 [Trebonia sp.]
MAEQSTPVTSAVVSELFTRLRGQLAEVATGQTAQAKETATLVRATKNAELLEVVKAVQAQQTAQSKAATALARAMTPAEKSASADLATLTAIVGQLT